MKIKKIVFLCLLFILCCSTKALAEKAEIYADVTMENGVVYANGNISGEAAPCSVSFIVMTKENPDSSDDIVCVDLVETDNNGNFEIVYELEEEIPYGQYPYRIGSDADVTVVEGVLYYYDDLQYATCDFMSANIIVRIDAYTPVITGTIECYRGRKVVMTVANVTDGIILSHEEFPHGMNNIPVSILSELSENKKYLVTLTCDNGVEKLCMLKLEVNTAHSLLNISASVQNAEGVQIDAVVENDTLNKGFSFAENTDISTSIPYIMLYSDTWNFSMKGSETTKEQKNAPSPINITTSDNVMLYTALKKAYP